MRAFRMPSVRRPVATAAGVVALALAGLGLGACATTGSAEPEVRYAQEPALWVVEDADSKVYLFGTVHVLKPETVWKTPRVEAALNDSKALWLELPGTPDQASMMPLIQRYGLSLDKPLSSRLDDAQKARLASAAQALGVPAAALEPLRPWLAGLQIGVGMVVKAGYDPNSGVEKVLETYARGRNMPINGFETIEQQLRFFADMDEATELAFLASSLEDFEQSTTVLDEMVAAWSSGDVNRLERAFVSEMREESPALYDRLLVDRNKVWAVKIDELLDGQDTVFVAVGAGHLVGDGSVQDQLEARGIKARRVR